MNRWKGMVVHAPDDETPSRALKAAGVELRARLERVRPRVMIDLDACNSCGRCVEICPTDVFRMTEAGKPAADFESDCCVCFLCQDDCPTDAIQINNAMSARGFRSIYDVLQIDISGSPSARAD